MLHYVSVVYVCPEVPTEYCTSSKSIWIIHSSTVPVVRRGNFSERFYCILRKGFFGTWVSAGGNLLTSSRLFNETYTCSCTVSNPEVAVLFSYNVLNNWSLY